MADPVTLDRRSPAVVAVAGRGLVTTLADAACPAPDIASVATHTESAAQTIHAGPRKTLEVIPPLSSVGPLAVGARDHPPAAFVDSTESRRRMDL
jgi:hypothetical protein